MAVSVARVDAPAALTELLSFSPAGVEEVDIDADTLAFVLYGAAGELPSLPDLRACVGGALVEVRTSEIADDWQVRWRSFHRPIEVAETLRVRAPWHPPSQRPLIDVVIEPAQAFGTGAHATTRLCLELIVALHHDGHGHGALLDVGTGSGVLAIAAAKLGWAPIVAVDSELESVDAARANVAENRVAVEVVHADARVSRLPSAPLVTANLIRPLLLELAELPPTDSPPRWLIASGLLREEADEIAARFAARHGMYEQQRLQEGEWAALLLVRP